MAVRLSIVTCTRNSMPLVRKCVATVKAALEGFRHDWEWIIVDANSTDGCLDTFAFSKEVRRFGRPAAGIYDALNFGVGVARGEFVSYVHSDDEVDCAFFRNSHLLAGGADPRIACEYGTVTFIDSHSKTLYSRTPPFFFEALNQHTNLIFHPNAIWRRNHELAHPYRTNVGAHADWLHTQELTRSDVMRNPRMEYRFRISAASTTRNNAQGRREFPLWNLALLPYETRVLRRLGSRLVRRPGFWQT